MRVNRSAILGAGVLMFVGLGPLSGARALVQTGPAPATLSVGGDVPSPAPFSAADLQGMPRTVITMIESGASVRYEGVAVADLLKKAGGPTGEALRGPALAHYVVATGADGYRAVFGVTEGDADFTDRPIIVADRRDGQPLSAAQGPFRLLASADKRPTRSVRTLVSLTLRKVD